MRIQNPPAQRMPLGRNWVSGPRNTQRFVPETWVTLRAQQARRVDALEVDFGHEGTPAIRSPLAGPGGYDRRYDLGSVDLEPRTLQTIDNPFGAKL